VDTAGGNFPHFYRKSALIRVFYENEGCGEICLDFTLRLGVYTTVPVYENGLFVSFSVWLRTSEAPNNNGGEPKSAAVIDGERY
jgi:hypothetical protein